MIFKRRLVVAVALLPLAAQANPASAQREIVQPLPAAEEAELGDALSRLARDATDVSALLDAGEAALELGDIEAAIGFFGRANELSPGNARTKVGLAKAYVRSRRPVEALRLFAEAETGGIPNAQMAEDRALAFDLVGDTASAQQLYRLALANGGDDQTTLRLAVSQAISGNREGFEETLLPLLRRNDVSAFRTRAFGLAILGDTREAKDIANTMLPASVGAKMAAYLDYMPQLTGAQQSAAANLGIFPRTSSIGTDDARISEYSGSPVRVATPPSTAAAAELPPVAPSPQTKAATGSLALTPIPSRSGESAPRSDTPSKQPSASVPDMASAVSTSAQASPRPSLASTISATGELPPSRSGPVLVASAAPTQAPTTTDVVPGGMYDPQPEPASVADAFDGFTLAPTNSAPAASGAVDITRISIPRERAEPKPAPKPSPPPVPSRHWVQVATGKNTDALKFDWRRITRNAQGKLDGKGPFVTPWGEANRLLSGPYDSAAKARQMVKELKELDIDSFTFTSAEGEEIDKL